MAEQLRGMAVVAEDQVPFPETTLQLTICCKATPQPLLVSCGFCSCWAWTHAGKIQYN